MKNLIKKFQNISRQYDLWKKGDKIAVACSGGPDSVCMLDIFARLAPKYNLKLIVVHVNYGLRGKESEKDEKFVRKMAEKHGFETKLLKLHFGKRTPPENELRNIRYDFFEKTRKENKLDFIAVAHNANDQAETFLMRVIRGAGLKGLSAMSHRNNFIIRPFLDVSRAEILEYLEKNKLKFRIDKTNARNVFFRNKVRNKLIPFLEKNFNPNVKRTISEAAKTIADDYDFLRAETEKKMETGKEMDAKKILNLHPALQKRIILKFITAIKGDTKDIESRHISEIIKIMKSAKNKRQALSFKGLKFIRKGDKIFILWKN